MCTFSGLVMPLLHVNKIQTTDHNYSYLTKFIAKLHGTNFGSQKPLSPLIKIFKRKKKRLTPPRS